MSGALRIRTALFPEDISSVLEIWREYVASPSVSLDYQGNDEEFAKLPGKYASPGGVVLLAEQGPRVVGCVAMRRIDAAIVEMKRLYVRPEARGFSAGRALAEAIVQAARQSGYREMRLDVLAEFQAAQQLYAALGFQPAEPVSSNPYPRTLFLGLMLT